MEAAMLDDATTLDQLGAIRAMINDTRRSTAEHWSYLLTWGVLGVIAAMASQLLLDSSHEMMIWLVWSGYWLLASVISGLVARRSERRTRTRTFVDRLLRATWQAVGIMIGLLWFATLIGAVPVMHMPAMIVWTAAVGLCVMAAALEFPILYAAAGLWWIGGVYALLRPRQAFAVVAVLLVLGYLVPAAMLRRQVAKDDAID
jgi:hypothetical protein